jgi:hypothetical protein
LGCAIHLGGKRFIGLATLGCISKLKRTTLVGNTV